MILSATVHEVKSSGDRLTVRLKARNLPTESFLSTILHEIEVPDSKTARRTYFIGRLVTIEVRPS